MAKLSLPSCFFICYSEEGNGKAVVAFFCFGFVKTKKATATVLPSPSILVLLQQRTRR
jgi:hypothetical protein